MPEHEATAKPKLSPEFVARLSGLHPQQKVRVIVLLQTSEVALSTTHYLRTDRKAAIDSVREFSKNALVDLNQIVQKFGGETLAEKADLLGSIPIEITAEGIEALAQSQSVKAVLEDQPIRSVY
jgi:hypothetical protein